MKPVFSGETQCSITTLRRKTYGNHFFGGLVVIDPFGPRHFAPPYLQPHQAQTHVPSDFENLLADGIEAAFAAGAWDLVSVVARLNADGLRDPSGAAWTETSFSAAMARLGA